MSTIHVEDRTDNQVESGIESKIQNRIKVLYIGGYGRSGSTLLVRLLGQLSGFHAVGEMWNIWQRSFAENELCGCGAPFHECSFWQAVVEEAFGGFHGVALDEIQSLRDTLQGQAYLAPIMSPRLRTTHQQAQIDAYLTVVKKLYCAIQSVAGCRTIIDSSKGPRYAALLREIPEIDLRVVHLIRDSRAVVHSWQKKMIKPEVYWKTAYLDRPNPIHAALNWNITNALTQSFRNSRAAYLFVRYEDLVEAPRAWLNKIAEFAGGIEYGRGGQGTDLFAGNDAVNLSWDHTAVGNPNRFRQGTVQLRRDDEWKKQMPHAHKYLVTTLTLPLLHKYGYLAQDRFADREYTA